MQIFAWRICAIERIDIFLQHCRTNVCVLVGSPMSDQFTQVAWQQAGANARQFANQFTLGGIVVAVKHPGRFSYSARMQERKHEFQQVVGRGIVVVSHLLKKKKRETAFQHFIIDAWLNQIQNRRVLA